MGWLGGRMYHQLDICGMHLRTPSTPCASGCRSPAANSLGAFDERLRRVGGRGSTPKESWRAYRSRYPTTSNLPRTRARTTLSRSAPEPWMIATRHLILFLQRWVECSFVPARASRSPQAAIDPERTPSIDRCVVRPAVVVRCALGGCSARRGPGRLATSID